MKLDLYITPHIKKKKKRIPSELVKDENFTYNVGKYLYDLGGGKDFFNKIQKNIK